jgi:hypothetical protein
VSVPENSYRCGVKSRWLLGDLDHLLMRLFKSEAILNLPPGSSSKWECVRDFARFLNKDTFCEIERFHDMGPVVYELKRYVGYI